MSYLFHPFKANTAILVELIGEHDLRGFLHILGRVDYVIMAGFF